MRIGTILTGTTFLTLLLALPLFAQETQPPLPLEKLTHDELTREFSAVQYLLGDEAKSEMKAIDDDGQKILYLRKLYASLDENLDDGELPFREMFYKRLDRADELFSTPIKEGWKRDRGRVLIQYGEPSDKDISQAIEVWHYYGIEGGVVFVFHNKGGLGMWNLVHSTKQGEIYDPQWNRLKGK